MDFKTELTALLPRLRRFALVRTGSLDAADDLVQAACERAWVARDTWKPGTRMDSWMFTIMQNLHIDEIRTAATHGIRESAETLEVVPDQRWSQGMEAGLALEQVARIMKQLPESMRVVLALVPIEGLTYQEAADVLGVPVGTVMSRLARARSELMRRLQAGAGEAGWVAT
ncbi:RNA polymerase sigma factor [Nevskia soli]|uniref:RNA polymerase sigma factor n=1 Tax=Nevskia soli TaxID=418856 RepID=UPI0004A6EC77|nr:RNA polymerase sigma factor [Nevskia soli]